MRIDVVNAVDFGYRTTWAERAYILRLLAIPFLIKLVCLAVLNFADWSQNYLRVGLVMMPATLAEGWALAHLVRLVFLNQYWPFRPTGEREADMAGLSDRVYGITAGTLCYVLIRHVQTGFMAFMDYARQHGVTGGAPGGVNPATPPDVDPMLAFGALFLLVLTVWAFRLMFLYIPLAAGMSMRVLLQTRRALSVSLQLFAVWLVSIVPALLLMVMLLSMILPPASVVGQPGFSPSFIQAGLLFAVQAGADIVMAVISTLAIAFAVRGMMEKEQVE